MVNKAVRAVEVAIEEAKVDVVTKEYKTMLQQGDMGNTVQVRFHHAHVIHIYINLYKHA